MEEKGILFNDTRHVGPAKAKTVVLNNPNKDNLKYEASLSCSPTKNCMYQTNQTSTYHQTKQVLWIQVQHICT